MKIVEIDNISVNYGSYKALSEVTLDVYQDDFLGVIGPNGGGKTTLIKAILGVIPYSGSINYAAEIYSDSLHKIGYLPQQENFDRSFPISIYDVVLSGLQSRKGLFGRYSSEDRDKAAELLKSTGISHIADKSVGSVSGGELQRALLCRAIISDPKLLILDEPANFVDNKFEKELYETLKELNKRMAIIMISHDLGTITSVVKSIVCVNRNVHRHNSNRITAEQLQNYDCPIQLVYHGEIPHTVLGKH